MGSATPKTRSDGHWFRINFRGRSIKPALVSLSPWCLHHIQHQGYSATQQLSAFISPQLPSSPCSTALLSTDGPSPGPPCIKEVMGQANKEKKRRSNCDDGSAACTGSCSAPHRFPPAAERWRERSTRRAFCTSPGNTRAFRISPATR